MQRDDAVYVGHMLDTARNATGKIHGLQRSDFDNDENLRLALAHLVQVIGEAARRVSQEPRGAHPEIPWADIVGMRSKIVHDYMSVDEDVVWEVVSHDLPTLISSLEVLSPESR